MRSLCLHRLKGMFVPIDQKGQAVAFQEIWGPIVDDLQSSFFAEMALDLDAAPTAETTLEMIVEYAQAATKCDDAGIMLVHARNRIETAAASSAAVAEAHNLQIMFDEGPCLDAIEGPPVYVVHDTLDDERWPQWGPAVSKIGIRSALGIRLATHQRRYGSLNLYSYEANAFGDEDVAVADIFASHAAVAVGAAHNEEGLQRAVDSRKTIGQAQGILMERFNIDADRAFSLLRRYSQDRNVKLQEIALLVVNGRQAPQKPAQGAGS
ncbi:GAF and ANTAR domain-containing protein [soil metagenome]